jgi:hypothetical protein
MKRLIFALLFCVFMGSAQVADAIEECKPGSARSQEPATSRCPGPSCGAWTKNREGKNEFLEYCLELEDQEEPSEDCQPEDSQDSCPFGLGSIKYDFCGTCGTQEYVCEEVSRPDGCGGYKTDYEYKANGGCQLL